MSAVLIALAACSGDDSDASADATSTTTSAVDTTTAPATTTTAPTPSTTAPPPYSFDGSVPPPPLVNTGDDFDAIYRSIDSYAHWITAHHPDSDLVREFAVVGSDAYRVVTDDIAALVDDHARVYDTASVVTSVEIADSRPGLATLRVAYMDGGPRVLVDSTGSVLDQKDLPARSSLIALLAADDVGRWRLVAQTPTDPDTEVDL